MILFYNVLIVKVQRIGVFFSCIGQKIIEGDIK